MNLNDLYQQLIIDHYKHPHGMGLDDELDVEVHHHNPTCGDDILLRAAVTNGVVREIAYGAQGCSISVASASMMYDLVAGQPVAKALELYDEMVTMLQTRDGSEPDEEVFGDAIALAGVAKFPARVKCALLGWAAMRDAVIQASAKETSA